MDSAEQQSDVLIAWSLFETGDRPSGRSPVPAATDRSGEGTQQAAGDADNRADHQIGSHEHGHPEPEQKSEIGHGDRGWIGLTLAASAVGSTPGASPALHGPRNQPENAQSYGDRDQHLDQIGEGRDPARHPLVALA